MATAITYRTGTSAGKLRTVLVEDARRAVVLLPAGRLEIMTAKLLRGRTDRQDWWNEVLGTEGDDFAVEIGQVVQTRELGPVITKRSGK